MTDGNNIVSIDNASYRFRDAKPHAFAFKDVSFFIARGEFLSVIGPSGAGKSTLLRSIAGLIPKTTGTIVRNFSEPAMVFQGHGIFPWLTIIENAAFGLHMRGMPKEKREKIAREKLKEVGLGGLEERYPHQLSGGQKQRVAIARAVAIEPDLLLMDEPFSSLDSITAASLKKDVLGLWQRYSMTVLMVNHLVSDAIELSDRVVVLTQEPGMVKKIITIGLPRPRDTRSKEFFELVDHLTALLEQ